MTASARFDGWRIVALGAALIWLGPGLLETYGFLVSPLGAEFGLGAQSLGAGIALFILALALSGPLVGALLDRGPLRPVLLGALALGAGSLAALSRAESLAALTGFAVLAAVGIGAYGQIGPQVMVASWFVRRRSRALALTSLGTSAAGITIPLIGQELIARLGWRGALLTLACAALVLLGPAIVAFAVRRPEDVGQLPDGDAPDQGVAPELTAGNALPSAQPAGAIRALLSDRNFWVLGASLAIATAASLGGVFVVKHMENVGVPASDARWVLSTMSVGAFLGRIATGWLHERFPKQLVAAAVFALSGIGWLGLAHSHSLAGFLAIALPSGFAGGGFGVSGPVLQAACFGPGVLGRVMGLHGVLGLPLLLAAPPLVGRAADLAGSFVPVFSGLAGVMLVGAAAMLLVRPPREGAR
jgi:MFS family permease